MRKFFGFGRHKVKISSTIQQRNGADTAPECSSRVSSGPKYHIRDKDLGKIHRAASAGNVRKVQEILLRKKKCLNDRDKKNRTALHLACANGHPEVVTLLTDNKCELNYCDNDNRTALMKAIQCQQEECAAILIKCGANPNVADIDGNTALHFAAAGQIMEIAEELLLNKADIEAKNKDDLTPLLLAIHEHRHKMAKFLVKKNANVHAVDRFKRTSLMLAVNDSSTELVKLLLQEGVDVLAKDINGSTAEEHAFKTGLTFNHKLIRDYKEEMIHKQSSEHSSQGSLKRYPQSKLTVEVTDSDSDEDVNMEAPQTSRSVRETSKEDSVSRKPQIDDSWSSGDSEEFSFHPKNVVNPSLAKIKTVIQQSLKNIEEKSGNLSTVKKGNEADSENEVTEDKVMAETLAKPSAAIHPDFPSTGPLFKPSVMSSAVIGLPEEEAIKPAIGNKENGMDVSERAPQEQANKNNVNYADGTHEYNTSGSLQNYPHLKPTTEVKDSVPKKAVEMKGIQTSQSDLSAELVLGRTSEKEPKGLAGSKNNHSQDFSASLPINCAVDLPGTADQNENNIRKEQEAVHESSEEESVSRKSQIDDSWSSGDSEEFSFHPKNVVNPSLAKIKTVVQQSLKNIEEKSGNLSTVKKGNEADSENEVTEDKVMAETLAKPSAAIHPDFPSTGPLFKPSVMSSAVIGLPEEEAIKPAIGNKENVEISALGMREDEEADSPWDSEDFSTHLPINCADDFPGAADQRGENIQNEQRADLSAELVLERTSEKEPKGPDGSKNNHSQEEAIKPAIGNKENVKMSALGIGEDKEADSPWDSEDFSTHLPINCADDFPGAADQRGENIQNEQRADLSAELVLERTSEKEPKGPDGSKNNHSQEEAIKPITGDKENVEMSALGTEDKEAESPWDSEDFSTSLPINYIEDLPGAADQKGNNIRKEQVAGSLENYSHLKPSIEVQDSDPKKAVETKGTQSSRSDSLYLDSPSLPLDHENCQGSGDLKVQNKFPFVSQSMTPKQSASTDIGHMTLTDKCKTNIRAAFLRGDQQLCDLREPQLPENRGSKEDLSAELVLGRRSEKEPTGLDGSKNDHSQNFSASVPKTYVDHLSGAADEREKNRLSGQEEGSHEKRPLSKPPTEVKDPVSKEAVGMKDTQTSRSDSLGRHPHSKPAVQMKDPVSKKAVEMKATQTSRSDSSDADSARSSLKQRSSQKSRDSNIDVQYPLVSHSITPNQPAFTDIGHTTIVDKEKMNIGVVLLIEDHRVHGLRESQLPENGESKEGSHEKRPLSKPPTEVKDPVSKEAVGMKDTQTSRSDSLGRHPHSKPAVQMKDPVSKKAVEMKATQTSRSDSSDADSARSSLKQRSSQKSRDSNIDVQYPLVSHSITPNQPAFTDIGHTTIVDKEKMNIGVVLLIEDHRVHGLRESQLPENGESKEGSHEKRPLSKPPTEVKDPVSKEAVGMKDTQTSRSDSLGRHPHSKPAVQMKDPVSKKAVEMKATQTSRSDSSDADSARSSLKQRSSQKSRDSNIDVQYPLVSHSITPNQPAFTDIGHTTIVDKEKMNIGAVLLIEDHRVHGLRESQLPENGESKEGSHEKRPLSKPPTEVKDPVSKEAVGMKDTQTSRSDSLGRHPHSKPAVQMKDPVSKKAVEMKATQTSRSDSSDADSARSSLKQRSSQKSRDSNIDVQYPLVSHSITPNQPAFTDIGHTTIVDKEKMNIGAVLLIEDHRVHGLRESQLPENGESKEGSHEKRPLSKPPTEVKDPVSKEAVGMKDTQTSRSDSLGRHPHSKPAVQMKDPVSKKAVEMKATQTSRSDSSDADSARSSLKQRSSQKSRDSNIDVQYPLVSHSITPNQPAFTDIGHTTIVDKEKMNIGVVLLIEDHRVHGLRESQLPENGESKEGSHEKRPLSKPPTEVKDPVSKEAVGMKDTQTSRSDSLGRHPHSKPAVQMKDPVSKKAVEMKATQTSRSDSSDADSARSSLKQRSSQKSRDSNIDVQYPLVSHSITPNQPAFTDIGHTTIVDKEKMNIGAVLLIEDHRVHGLRESQLPENGESKEDSLEKYPHLKHIVEGKDPVPKKAVGMKATQTSRSDSLETYPHLKPAVKVKDPVSRKAVGMKATQTSRSESVSLLKIQDGVMSNESLIELKKNHCELLTGKIKEMENKVIGLQKELSETKEVKSQLECQKEEWEHELCNLRFTLRQEKERRENTDMLYKKVREQLIKTEEQYHKEVEMKQLEITLRTLDMELKTVRNNFNQVVEELNDTKRQLSQEQNARISQDAILTNHLCKQKEIEINLKKMNSEVSDSHAKERDLLHENHMLQEEIAMLRLEIDTVKNQKQEMEKKYLEDITIVKEKNDQLQKTVKLNEETLTKTVFQYTGQLNVLAAENTMLNSKLENEKQNKDGLETEVESCRSRLATAVHDHEQGQTSKRDLEFAFQRARDEWFRLRDKMDFDMSKLKDNNEILSQQLSKAESNLNSLETELHHTRDALRERTLVLERVQTDLSQIQCQKKEIEHMYQNEQAKVNKYIGKQESLEERFSHLQSENALLRQERDDARSKTDSKEKTIIHIQDQFQDIIKTLQAEKEKQGRMLEERNKELINECNHLKERIYQYENEKAEREVVVRQLQQELADTLKKQSMSEASLEVTARYRMNLEDETQDLKKKLNQVRSQLQEASDQHAEAVRRAEKTKDHMQKLETENAKLKITVKKQVSKMEQLQENLLGTSSSEDAKEQLKNYMQLKRSLEYSLDQEKKKNGELEKEVTRFKKLLKLTRRKLDEYENGELRFPGDLKPTHIEMDIQINMLKQKIDDLTAKLETSSLKCLRLDEENQLLRQELVSMKGIQKKCEIQENEKKKLKQDLVNLKSHMEMNMVDYGEVEKYKWEIEERARQEIVEKLKEVNLFLQAQAVAQENLDQLRENNNTSMRSEMERRIKDLESELCKMKTSQEESNKVELEKYKQLYLQELKSRKSLAIKLNETDERLAEMNTKLLLKKQQNKSLLSSLLTRPVLEPQGIGSLNHGLISHSNLAPRADLVTPVSTPRTSKKSLGTYLTKVQHEFEENLNRELKEAAAEFESESYRPSTLCSVDGSNLYQDLVLKTSREYAQILKKNYMI